MPGVAKRSGGKRPGAGRKPKTLERCYCGRHTLARAVLLRLKCRRPAELPAAPVSWQDYPAG